MSDPAAALQRQVTEAIATASPSVVAIQRSEITGNRQLRSPQPPPTLLLSPFTEQVNNVYGTGAGVVIDASGLILTQYLNVGEGDRHIVFTQDRQSYPATIKAADPRSGLAVLEVKGATLSPIEFAAADNVARGQFVVAVANPTSIVQQGVSSASFGIVSNVGIRAPTDAKFNDAVDSLTGMPAATLHQLGTLIETDARVGWSSGGGALVDLQGRLIGLMTDAVALPGQEAAAHYAIPMNGSFRKIIDRLKQGKEVEYALLGVSLDNTDAMLGQQVDQRATVSRVVAGGPAARAGIRTRDVITKVDGIAISSAQDLQLKVGVMQPGSRVPVEFVRAGSTQETELVLAKFYVPGKKVVTASRPSWRGMRIDFSTALPYAKLEESSQAGLVDPAGCVVVSAVREGSAAWQSGVRPGMFISHVGDERVTTPDEFFASVAESNETLELRFTDSAAKTPEEGKP